MSIEPQKGGGADIFFLPLAGSLRGDTWHEFGPIIGGGRCGPERSVAIGEWPRAVESCSVVASVQCCQGQHWCPRQTVLDARSWPSIRFIPASSGLTLQAPCWICGGLYTWKTVLSGCVSQLDGLCLQTSTWTGT